MPKIRRVTLADDSKYGLAAFQEVERTWRSGRLTQGPKVRAFENMMHHYLGLPAATRTMMVNSGSSANLLAAHLLKEACNLPRIRERRNRFAGDERMGYEHAMEVITPALTWSTTVAPLIQLGFKPVFVDVGTDLQVDPRLVENAITGDTVAIVAPHLLGVPFDAQRIADIAAKHGLFFGEDCCEALGARVEDHNGQLRHVGSFGHASTFSFYHSHHLSTVEGGLLAWPRQMRQPLAWREHGWIREYEDADKVSVRVKASAQAVGDSGLDDRWIFDELGYNLRSTDMNAAIGIAGLRSVPRIIRKRQIIAANYSQLDHPALERVWTGVDPVHRESSPFSYPFMMAEDSGITRRDVMGHLEKEGIETRPIMTGNLTRHPWYQRPENAGKWRIHGTLDRTDAVHRRGFLLPIHQGISGADAARVRATLFDFLESRVAAPTPPGGVV